MTQLHVSKRLRWSQSKINRIESGESGISYTDLNALLRLYKVHDEEMIENMAKMADIARRRSLPALGEIYSDRAFRRFLELEEIASRVWQFEISIIPGLLQTRSYAEAALRNNVSGLDELTGPELQEKLEEIDKKLKFRLSRQDAFFAAVRQGALKGSFILDEAALHRNVGAESGGSSVMPEQLQHLKRLARAGEADIGVVPFAAGMHAGMSGPFVILDFPDVDDQPLLYVENPLADFATTEEPELTRRFSSEFEALQDKAVRGVALEALIDDALNKLSKIR